jgi:hypothetical protein
MKIKFERMIQVILYLAFIMLPFSNNALSQGTIYVPPVHHDFSINCDNPSLGSSYTPNGEADIINNVLTIRLSLGLTAATDGWIASITTNGSLTPIFPLLIQTNAMIFGIPGFRNVPPPILSYSVNYEMLQLADGQASSLWDGLWYVQINYPTGTVIGEIAPVPEPTTLALLAGGIIALFKSKHRFRLKNR